MKLSIAMENWVLQRTKSINVQKRCDKSKCKVISNFIVWVLDLRFLEGSVKLSSLYKHWNYHLIL